MKLKLLLFITITYFINREKIFPETDQNSNCNEFFTLTPYLLFYYPNYLFLIPPNKIEKNENQSINQKKDLFAGFTSFFSGATALKNHTQNGSSEGLIISLFNKYSKDNLYNIKKKNIFGSGSVEPKQEDLEKINKILRNTFPIYNQHPNLFYQDDDFWRDFFTLYYKDKKPGVQFVEVGGVTTKIAIAIEHIKRNKLKNNCFVFFLSQFKKKYSNDKNDFRYIENSIHHLETLHSLSELLDQKIDRTDSYEIEEKEIEKLPKNAALFFQQKKSTKKDYCKKNNENFRTQLLKSHILLNNSINYVDNSKENDEEIEIDIDNLKSIDDTELPEIVEEEKFHEVSGRNKIQQILHQSTLNTEDGDKATTPSFAHYLAGYAKFEECFHAYI